MASTAGSGILEGDRQLLEPTPGGFGTLPTATGGLARIAYARAREAGIELDPLLTKAGLTHEQIENRHVRITVASQVSFLDLVARALSDDLLGFHLALLPDLREIGLLFYVMASSDRLHEALQKAARYSSIVNDGISLRYIEGIDATLALSYVGVDRYRDRHHIECWMTLIVRICRQLTGLRVAPSRVRLIHRGTRDRVELGRFFDCDVEFGADADAIAFSTGIRDMPVVDADPYLNSLLTTYCEDALSRKLRNAGSSRTRVENAIVPLLPHGKAQIGEIALRLGVSQRTLARQLSSEGTTFSEVMDHLRSKLATHYLQDDDLSISQIAWLLGYQEVSAFSHAFKRWTGDTPRRARACLAS